MRISDWSSDMCSSDLHRRRRRTDTGQDDAPGAIQLIGIAHDRRMYAQALKRVAHGPEVGPARVDDGHPLARSAHSRSLVLGNAAPRSEEHTSELQSLMRISYAVFCLKKKNKLII